MPIYEYVCMECESHFEELVRGRRAGQLSRLRRDERLEAVLLLRGARHDEGRERRWRRWLLRRLLRLRPLARGTGGRRRGSDSGRACAAPGRARGARGTEAEAVDRGDRDRAGARRSLRELRVPRGEERAGTDGGADPRPPPPPPARDDRRRGGGREERRRHRRFEGRARARRRHDDGGRDHERRRRLARLARRPGAARQEAGRHDQGRRAARPLERHASCPSAARRRLASHECRACRVARRAPGLRDGDRGVHALPARGGTDAGRVRRRQPATPT